MKKKDEIIMWDDAPFLFSKPDSKEQITKDIDKLLKDFEKRERYPFSGIIQLLEDAIATKVFLMRFNSILKRIKRLEK